MGQGNDDKKPASGLATQNGSESESAKKLLPALGRANRALMEAYDIAMQERWEGTMFDIHHARMGVSGLFINCGGMPEDMPHNKVDRRCEPDANE